LPDAAGADPLAAALCLGSGRGGGGTFGGGVHAADCDPTGSGKSDDVFNEVGPLGD